MAKSKSILQLELRMLSVLGVREKDTNGNPLPDTNQVCERFSDRIDANLGAKIFTNPVLVHLYGMLREYRSKYKKLPANRLTFETFLDAHPTHAKWVSEAEVAPDLTTLTQAMQVIFGTITDREYYYDQIKNIFAGKLVKMELANITEAASSNEDTADILRISRTAIHKAENDIDYVINGTQRDILDYELDYDELDFSDMGGMETIIERFNLYRDGLSVIMSAPKMGKTRLTVEIAYALLKAGLNILYMDVENGQTNMAMRFKALEIRDFTGYAPPSEAFQSNCLLDHTWVKGRGASAYCPDTAPDYLTKGDKVFRPRYYSVEVEKDGVKRKKWKCKLDLFLAKTNDVTIGELPAKDHDNTHYEYKGSMSTKNPEKWWMPLSEVNAKMKKAGMTKGRGKLKIVYDRTITPSSVEGLMMELAEEHPEQGWGNPWRTVIVLDWMSQIKPDGGRSLPGWEASRLKYSQFRTLQGNIQQYVLPIAGISNKDEAEKMDAVVSRIKPANNTQIGFDAVCVWVLIQGPEEKANRCLRFVPWLDRYGGEDCYIQTDPSYMGFKVLTHEQYAEINPETWAHITSAGSSKGEAKVRYQQAQESDDILGDLLG